MPEGRLARAKGVPLPRGSEQHVAKNAPQQGSAKHMAPKCKPTSGHFVSNKEQRDATQHNTTPRLDTLLGLTGGISKQVTGGGKPPLWGAGGSEERKKRRKEERKKVRKGDLKMKRRLYTP